MCVIPPRVKLNSTKVHQIKLQCFPARSTVSAQAWEKRALGCQKPEVGRQTFGQKGDPDR